jgi:hypothetical protein
MADAEIGALRVTLAMNAGEFERGARKVEESVGKLSDKFEGLSDTLHTWGKVAEAAFAVFVASLPIMATKEAIDRIDALGKSAEKLDMPAEKLSAFGFAAESSGVKLDSLTSGLEELRKNMSQVAKGDSEDLKKALDSIGVSVTDDDGNLRSIGDVLGNVSDKFADFKNTIERTEFATKLFGSSGAELIPMLTQGSEKLKEATENARIFGAVMTTESAQAASKLSDNVNILSMALQGVWNKVAAEVLPALADLSAQAVAFAKDFKIVDIVSNDIIEAIRMLRVDISNVGYAFQAIGVIANSSMKIASDAFALLPLALEVAMKDLINQAAIGMEGVVNTIVAGLAKAAGVTDAITGAGLGQKITDSMSIDLGRLNTEQAAANYDALAARIGETTAAMSSQLSSIGSQAQTSAKAIMDGWSAHIEDAAQRIPKSTAPIVQAEKEDAEAKAELNKQINEGIRLAKAIETPRETELRQLDALQKAYEKGKISAEAMGKAQVAAAWTAQSAYAGLASNVMSSLGKLFENNKAIAIATALVNTYEGVSKALATYPPPYSFIAAGAALAAGLAQVLNIKNTNKNSQGSGGSGMSGSVGGGAAAADSGGGGGGAGGPASAPQLLTVRGINAGQMFSGEVVRELAAQLIAFQKDGGQVVVV